MELTYVFGTCTRGSPPSYVLSRLRRSRNLVVPLNIVTDQTMMNFKFKKGSRTDDWFERATRSGGMGRPYAGAQTSCRGHRFGLNDRYCCLTRRQRQAEDDLTPIFIPAEARGRPPSKIGARASPLSERRNIGMRASRSPRESLRRVPVRFLTSTTLTQTRAPA